jgi:hypothetical protein
MHEVWREMGQKARNHKCPEKVALHVLEEVMAAVQPDTIVEEVSDTTSEDSSDGEQVFALSNFAAAGVQGKKTIKLIGLVNNQQILILIDSGSSCTFISEKAVDTLRLAVTKVPSISVTVANGDTISSVTLKCLSSPGGVKVKLSLTLLEYSSSPTSMWFLAWIGWNNSVQCGSTGNANHCGSHVKASRSISRASRTASITAPK